MLVNIKYGNNIVFLHVVLADKACMKVVNSFLISIVSLAMAVSHAMCFASSQQQSCWIVHWIYQQWHDFYLKQLCTGKLINL